MPSAKKTKPSKTKEQRAKEIEKLMGELLDFGFPLEHPAIQEFIKITKTYEEDGIGTSGTLKLNGYKRNLSYILSKQPHIDCRIVLEHNPYI